MSRRPPLFYVSIHFEEVKREAFFVSMRSKGLSESVKNGLLENSEVEWAAHKEGKQKKRRLNGAKNCSEAKNPRRATSADKEKREGGNKEVQESQYEKGRAEARRSEIPGGQGIEP